MWYLVPGYGPQARTAWYRAPRYGPQARTAWYRVPRYGPQACTWYLGTGRRPVPCGTLYLGTGHRPVPRGTAYPGWCGPQARPCGTFVPKYGTLSLQLYYIINRFRCFPFSAPLVQLVRFRVMGAATWVRTRLGSIFFRRHCILFFLIHTTDDQGYCAAHLNS